MKQTVMASVLMSVSHFILEGLTIGLESDSINESLLKYIIVCYNARSDWIPYEDFFLPWTEENKLKLSAISEKIFKKDKFRIKTDKIEFKNTFVTNSRNLVDSLRIDAKSL